MGNLSRVLKATIEGWHGTSGHCHLATGNWQLTKGKRQKSPSETETEAHFPEKRKNAIPFSPYPHSSSSVAIVTGLSREMHSCPVFSPIFYDFHTSNCHFHFLAAPLFVWFFI